MAKSFIEQFAAARKVSTPLIVIRTPDPSSTIKQTALIVLDIDKKNKRNETPLIVWDVVNGAVGLNLFPKIVNDKTQPSPGELNVQTWIDRNKGEEPNILCNPTEVLIRAWRRLAKFGVLYMINPQRFLGGNTADPTFIQAIWNLRDAVKERGATVVFLCPDITLPPELANDVLVLDEPLPNRDQLAAIVTQMHKDAGANEPTEEVLKRAVDALAGLSAFPADQVTAMSITRNGLDIDSMYERKRKQIEQTPGLAVWRGGERFSDIGGLENIKSFLNEVIKDTNPNRPAAFVFQDEIDKDMAGSGSDLSGVTQEMLKAQLTFMQDKKAKGILLLGPGGVGKTEIAKAVGNEAGIPVIQMNLGDMKGSLVGESNANIRLALKVVEAVSQERAFFIATCNNIDNLPPELLRRFKFGKFFFDLPSSKERDVIWGIHMGKFNLPKQKKPDDRLWTGSEIQACCEMAHDFNRTLIEAAKYIVPIAKSKAKQLEALRREADGNYISASTSGNYEAPKTIEEEKQEGIVVVGAIIPGKSTRKFSKEDVN